MVGVALDMLGKPDQLRRASRADSDPVVFAGAIVIIGALSVAQFVAAGILFGWWG